MRKLELREMKFLAQGNSTRRWLNWNSNPNLPDFKVCALYQFRIDGFPFMIEGPAGLLGKESLSLGDLDSVGRIGRKHRGGRAGGED